MSQTAIRVNSVTRVEGHGNLVLNLSDGRVDELRLEIAESPRFFEVMLRGRSYEEAAYLSGRICGICSVAHTTTSLRAVEAAIGCVPSEQTVALRKLLLHAEMLQSHLLHVYFLALPDFLGAGSAIALAGSHREVVQRALRMKRLANEICEVITGRHVHPLAHKINGFSRLPTLEELATLRAGLLAAREDMQATVELVKGLEIPDFQRETEYLSLHDPDEYAFYQGDIVSSDDPKPTPLRLYKERVREFIVEHSSAKHARSRRDSYMVGALARLNNNFLQLHPEAQRAAKTLGLTPPCYNPFVNNLAQVVESVHCLEESLTILDNLLSNGIANESFGAPPGAGRGVGACEAPRGTLYHEFVVDEAGKIVEANLIIPTAQNLANLEDDIRAFAPQIAHLPEERIRLLLEMLVRAYDPCISCAVHLLDVKFR